MNIPESALRFIDLQRTGFKNKTALFISEMEKEFNEIKPYLPEECRAVLDIGCGLSVIDVFLNNHYKDVKLFLADKNKTDKEIHYGYKSTGSFYNSFPVVTEFLNLNGIKNFQLIESEKGNDIPYIGNVDIVISLLSCGYHYNIGFYLDKINEVLSETGVLILDIREHTKQIDQVKKVFPIVDVIRHENKAYRICAKRKTINHRNKKVIGDVNKERNPYTGKMRWEAVLDRLPKNKKLIGAEIGVLHGETAYRILKERPEITHIMIDPWAVHPRGSSFDLSGDNCSKKPQTFHDNAFNYTKKRVAFAGERAIIYRMFSHEAVKNIEDDSLDYCFVDGDHSYEGCLKDIQMWIKKVKLGGWIGGHDYGNERLPGVKKAVDEFFKGEILEFDHEDTWFYFIGGRK